LLVVLATCVAQVPAVAQVQAGEPDASGVQAGPVRIILVSDLHSRLRLVDRFIAAANASLPDVIIDGGDIVHDGTESEFRRADADRARLVPPVHAVPGNHDMLLRGPFTGPRPDLPAFATANHGDVRVVLLDNHEGELTEEQFRLLEAELVANAGRRTFIVMHVPPRLGREPFLMRLRHLLPFRLARPTMRDADQVGRFLALMERHRVVAVLTGHSHFHDHQVHGGVHYIVAGAAGGLTPGLGVANEYIELTLDGRDVGVRRVALNRAAGDPVTFIARAFRFYADLNGFNHAEQGWNYVPSASVQLRSALELVKPRRATADHPRIVLAADASFERSLGAAGRQAGVADIGLIAGEQVLAARLMAGWKLRAVGDYNRNVFLSAGGTANAGLLAGRLSAGVGARAGVGIEWHHVTAELGVGRATNQSATAMTIGHRF
jgi:predicted phosphodiesterase